MHSTLSSRICTMTRCDLACLQHGGPVQRHGGPAVQRHGGLHQPGGSAAPRCRRGSAAAPRRAPWSSSDWVLASPNELRPSAPCSSPSLSPVYVGSGRAWLLGLSGSSAGSAGSQSSLNPSANSTSSGPVPRSVRRRDANSISGSNGILEALPHHELGHDGARRSGFLSGAAACSLCDFLNCLHNCSAFMIFGVEVDHKLGLFWAYLVKFG
jgi:hypothetical protein